MMQPEELVRRVAGLVPGKRSAEPTVVTVDSEATGVRPGQVESVGSRSGTAHTVVVVPQPAGQCLHDAQGEGR